MAHSLCFYFQVHQPFRLGKVSYFHPSEKEIFEGPEGFLNRDIFEKVANKCYLPTTDLLLKLIQKHPEFHASFSLSGVFLEQCEQFGAIGKKVLNNFKALVDTGRVELINETYYHSLSFFFSKEEFSEQVLHHQQTMQRLFGVTPTVFRNTELVYTNELAEYIRQLGFTAIIAEGWKSALTDDSQNPNIVRLAEKVSLPKDDREVAKKFRKKLNLKSPPVKGEARRAGGLNNNNDECKNIADVSLSSTPSQGGIKVLTKNYKLSDDIAFRFGNKHWAEFPMDTAKFTQWVTSSPGDTVNLFMDFETFGEHQWEETKIFEFLEHLPQQCEYDNISFRTPSQTLTDFTPQGQFSSHHPLSWADEERDLSAWLENDLQKSAFSELASLEKMLHQHKHSDDKQWKHIWDLFRKIQTSDHLYYMSTKYFADGDVHTYFSPYKNPYDAYIYFMNGLEYIKEAIEQKKSGEYKYL